jgi:hypothetical protein
MDSAIKSELLQLNQTQFICPRHFVKKKLETEKTWPTILPYTRQAATSIFSTPILKTIFLLSRSFFRKVCLYVLFLSIQERVMMARVWYINF